MEYRQDMTGTDQTLSQNRNKWLFAQYTVLFCVFTVGIFFALFITQRTFMQFHDAYTQGVFRLLELRNQMESIASGNGFSFWSWYEGPGMDEPLENFIEIGSLVGALFPAKLVEIGLTVAALVRMYLGGIAFLLLGREVELTRRQNLIGALLYVFAACFIGMAIRQSEMLVNAYLFPLLVLAVDRIYKEKSPAPFILVVAYYMAVTIYNAYMSAIVIVIYILLRYLHYNDEFKLKAYAATIGRFILYGIIGMVISAVGSLFSMITIQRASSGSSLDAPGALFDPHQYALFGKMILGSGATYDYLDIGIPIAVLLLLPIAITRCSRRTTNVIMFILLFIMMMIPFCNSMFNGFGYVSFRWSYMLLLFAVWSGVEQFDAKAFQGRKGILLAALALVIFGAWAVGPYLIGETSIGRSGRFFWAVQIAAGIALLFVFHKIGKKGDIGKKAVIAVLLISVASLSLGWSAGFYGNRTNFAKPGTVLHDLESSTLRVSNQIDDTGFYRIDSVDGMNRDSELRFPANENIWWKSNNLFIYNSRVPETVTDFYVQLGNSYGYARRVYQLSNGNRMGLDFLYGVRYFLGSDSKKKGYEDSDRYAGYGFAKEETIDGVNVWKNKYDVGLGFVYPQAISEKEFAKLDGLQKEQAMMQAAVVPEEEMDDAGAVRFVEAKDLDYDIKDMPYQVVATDGLTMEKGRIKATRKNASLTLDVKGIPDSQLMVSFDHLQRNTDKTKSGESYEVVVSDGNILKEVVALKSRQGVEGLLDHDLSLGYHKGEARIRIAFERKGTYTFDGIHVYAMSTALYDRNATERMAGSLNVTGYDDGKVKGTVNAGDGGILYLSIPVHDSWDVLIDGKRVEPVDDLNVTFMGVYVPAGEHEVTLVYDNRYVKAGAVISLIGLLAMVVVLIRRRVKRK